MASYSMSQAEAEAQLITVRKAINDLCAQKSLTELRVGSGEFQRTYTFSQITLSMLKALEADLLAYLASFATPADPVFRQTSCIPLYVRKERN